MENRLKGKNRTEWWWINWKQCQVIAGKQNGVRRRRRQKRDKPGAKFNQLRWWWLWWWMDGWMDLLLSDKRNLRQTCPYDIRRTYVRSVSHHPGCISYKHIRDREHTNFIILFYLLSKKFINRDYTGSQR